MAVDLFLGLLCLVTIVLAVTMIRHFFFIVPFVPTSMSLVNAMIDAADLQGSEVVCDLGAGDARMLIRTKQRFPGSTVIGCELVTSVWLLGLLRIWWSGEQVTLFCKNAYKMEVGNADVLLLYLLPSMLGKLGERFDEELKPGTKVVSNTFRFPQREPKKTIEIGKKKVFVYEW